MGFIGVFKTIGKGIGKGFVAAGKGVAKGVDVADDALDHPAAKPAQVALSLFVPAAWVGYGIGVVRSVKATADEIRDTPDIPDMTDEDKRALFAEKFREQYPEASDGDVATLASVLVKLEKQENE